MEKRRTRMGVDSTIDENDFGDELNSKGFLLANFDKLITWARTGSLCLMTFGLVCCGKKIKRKNVFNR